MKPINIIVLLCSIIILVGCQSQYRGRMVRVKTQAKKENTIERKVTRASSETVGVNSEHTLAMPQSIEEPKYTQVEPIQVPVTGQKSSENIKQIDAKWLEVIKEPKDTVIANEPSEEFIKKEYKKANNMTFIALALLIVSPYTLLLSLIAVFILTLKAIKIYRKYENPGVRERYILAFTLLVLSCLVVLFSAGLLYLLAVL